MLRTTLRPCRTSGKPPLRYRSGRRRTAWEVKAPNSPINRVREDAVRADSRMGPLPPRSHGVPQMYLKGYF